jgi:hypothetical protein
MTDILTPVQATEFAGLDADDLQSLRRKHTADYLKAREAHEDSPTDIEAWTLYQSWAGTLVEILVAAGNYQTAEDAGTALQALTFAQAAERFVELWASREDLLWDLSDEAICAVADNVRQWVAEGGELGQMPMREWTAPYLAVTR